MWAKMQGRGLGRAVRIGVAALAFTLLEFPFGTATASASTAADVLAVDAMSLVPGAEGNTVHDRQPIALDIPGAAALGIDLDAVTVTVTDRSTGVVQHPAVRSSRLVDGVGRIRTEAGLFQAGHDYLAEVMAPATSGTVKRFAWTFRRMDVVIRPTTATVHSAPGRQLAPGEWTFVPKLDVGPFEAWSDRTAHSGFGPVGQKVPLGGLLVTYVAGDGSRVSVPAYLPDATATVYKQFMKVRGETAATAKFSSQTVRLSPMTVVLPAEATDARLEPASLTTVPYTPAQDCVAPSASMPACAPDPFRFFMPEDFATDALDFQAEKAATPVLGESPAYLTQLVPDPENPLRGVWMPVSLDRGIVNTSLDEDVVQSLEGVSYAGTVWPHTPSQFADACSLGYACTSQAAAAASTSDLRQRCVRPDGQDRLTDAYAGQTKDCRQLNVISDIKTGDIVYYNGFHRRFAYATLSQIGYNDNHSSSPNEEIGIAWDDATGWAYSGGWQAGRYDVYWCNGSEYQPTPSHPWVHNVFEATAQDQYTPWASLGPYGQSMVEARQWKRSTDFGVSSANTNCTGFYENPNFRTGGNAIARAKILYVEAYADPTRTGQNGTAIGTFTHIWTRYSYEFKIYTEVGCSFPGGCGPAAGFEIRPYQESKSKMIQYPRGFTLN